MFPANGKQNQMFFNIKITHKSNDDNNTNK